MLSKETKLCMAAAYNGRLLVAQNLQEGNLKEEVLCEVKGFFAFDPDSVYFEQATVLGELEAIPDDEGGALDLLELLGQIGFRSPPVGRWDHCFWTLEPLLWNKFVNDILKEDGEVDAPEKRCIRLTTIPGFSFGYAQRVMPTTSSGRNG